MKKMIISGLFLTGLMLVSLIGNAYEVRVKLNVGSDFSHNILDFDVMSPSGPLRVAAYHPEYGLGGPGSIQVEGGKANWHVQIEEASLITSKPTPKNYYCSVNAYNFTVPQKIDVNKGTFRAGRC